MNGVSVSVAMGITMSVTMRIRMSKEKLVSSTETQKENKATWSKVYELPAEVRSHKEFPSMIGHTNQGCWIEKISYEVVWKQRP